MRLIESATHSKVIVAHQHALNAGAFAALAEKYNAVCRSYKNFNEGLTAFFQLLCKLAYKTKRVARAFN